jgi:hypothetical protein
MKIERIRNVSYVPDAKVLCPESESFKQADNRRSDTHGSTPVGRHGPARALDHPVREI